MADFKSAYYITSKIEGGYSNHPSDTGGETWKGIARKKNPNWSGWVIIDAAKNKPNFPASLDLNNELQLQLESFYKKQYWDIIKLDDLKIQEIANKLFDMSVNMGAGTAGRFLQKALNLLNRNGKYYPDLAIDGIVGPATIAAIHKHPTPGNILKALNVLQGARYLEIGETNASQEAFMNGWFENRIAGIFPSESHNDMA